MRNELEHISKTKVVLSLAYISRARGVGGGRSITLPSSSFSHAVPLSFTSQIKDNLI